MKLYNTLSRKKEEFTPLGEPVRIYACGPTVYNFIHIGNARPLTVFDVLRRYLEYRGHKVLFVQNFTDIDDKMIARANLEGVTVAALAERFIAEYRTDAAGLNVREADIHPRATENIDEIIALIASLVEEGFAYEGGGDVYFRARRFEDYGKLSHQPIDDLEAGARIDVNEVKEDPMDFALWKGAKPGEPSWPSPWGEGRPGWHIECSAMARRYLGKTIDIHCGGQDLVFPHHENEIAQSECANGCEFARFWLHNGYLNIDNRKMSKSAGNFFTVREISEKYGYEPIRFLMLSAHYRSPINYSPEIIEQAVSALGRLYTCRENLDYLLQGAKDENNTDEAPAQFDEYRRCFIEAMEDDLNTADAIAAVFDLVKEINIRTGAGASLSKNAIRSAAALLDELCGVLGLLYSRKRQSANAEIEALVEKRQQARKSHDFKTADAIRDELKSRGITLEDSPQGVKIVFEDR
ncbi:MAG: cysteine--tRNA ligase [Clostridia bacterium]|nr:cysteine--tRNA ligase [Clostridia bacterium]